MVYQGPFSWLYCHPMDAGAALVGLLGLGLVVFEALKSQENPNRSRGGLWFGVILVVLAILVGGGILGESAA